MQMPGLGYSEEQIELLDVATTFCRDKWLRKWAVLALPLVQICQTPWPVLKPHTAQHLSTLAKTMSTQAP